MTSQRVCLLFLTIAGCTSPTLGAEHCQMLGLQGTAADKEACIPFAGLGTGDVSDYTEDRCGFFCNLTQTWLRIGGRRTDSSDSYGNEAGLGIAFQRSGLNRSSYWITTKIGPPHWNFPLGFNSTLKQFEGILKNYSTSYVDLLLIHQPTSFAPELPGWPSSDAVCRLGKSDYDEKACRLTTWRAMLSIWHSGRARAIGVSNWKIEHIQELEDAGLQLPSVNQVPHNLENPQVELHKYCVSKGIRLQAYSSFGGNAHGGSDLSNPVVKRIAGLHNVTPPRIILNWQYRLNVTSNPGFKPCPVGADPCHIGPQPPVEYMKENLDFIDGITLSDQELAELSNIGSRHSIRTSDAFVI